MIVKELDEKQAKRIIEKNRKSGKPFQLIMSNYTVAILSESIKIRFIKEKRDIAFFNIFNALKKEVTAYIEKNKIELPKDLQYFHAKVRPDFSADTVYNTDLSSAYLQVLINEQIISETMYDKLAALPKRDRLAVVGMLASRKHVYNFDENGKIASTETIQNKELAAVFFWCVHVVSLVMNRLREVLGDDYIFSWVDGIYYTGEENVKRVSDELFLIGYPHTSEVLKNFTYKHEKNVAYINFDKTDENKPFAVPTKKDIFAREVYKHLNAINHDRN